MGDYILQFDAQYNIQAGQGSFNVFGGQNLTTWPKITCIYPPGQNTMEPR